MSVRPPSLNRDFAKLWAGQTISEVGSRITREGLPLTALLVLHASATQMGVLSAVGSLSVLVFGLLAGVAVDRWRKKSLMVGTDLARALLLAVVPLGFVTHRLSMELLILVAAAAGVLTVLFDVAYQSFLPVLLPHEELMEGNRRLSMSSSAAEMMGPALTGVLVQAITAPLAILLDACSFLLSAVSLWTIPDRETLHEQSRSESVLTEALAGVRFIWTDTILRALLLRSATAFLFMGFIFTLYMLNAIRVVHLSTAALGLTISLGGVGALAGAYLSRRIISRLGVGATFWLSAVLMGLMQLLIPLSSEFPRLGFACLCLQQLAGDMCWTIYFVNEMTIRQTRAPGLVIGRVNAAMQLASRGMLPFGALASGFLADRWGVAQTLWIGAAGVLLSSLWLLPLRREV